MSNGLAPQPRLLPNHEGLLRSEIEHCKIAADFYTRMNRPLIANHYQGIVKELTKYLPKEGEVLGI